MRRVSVGSRFSQAALVGAKMVTARSGLLMESVQNTMLTDSGAVMQHACAAVNKRLSASTVALVIMKTGPTMLGE